MNWLPWTADAFARAARERKPILLSITAAWCRACHEMDRTTYADPEVERLAADRFVAIRVDADCRPDINERYNLGGWPTTAFLTPEGSVIGGGTFVPLDRMPGVLRQVSDAYRGLRGSPRIESPREGHRGLRGSPRIESPSSVDPADDEAAERPPAVDGEKSLVDTIFATYDGEHGGFGIEPKFPLTAPLRLAMILDAAQPDEPDPRWRAMVERTLDAMREGALRDAADGAFHRYATTRDWQLPHAEKLLDVNAALLTVYTEAFVRYARDADRATAAAVAAFIVSRLGTPRGYAGSDADAAVYTDSTARATAALLAFAEAVDDLSIARDALARFEGALLVVYKPGQGLAHTAGVRGLLTDQIAVIDALLTAHDLSGDEPYRMLAEELALYAVRVLQDPQGGFLIAQGRAPHCAANRGGAGRSARKGHRPPRSQTRQCRRSHRTARSRSSTSDWRSSHGRRRSSRSEDRPR